MIAQTFRHVQDRVGDRLGRDVSLVSITVDPKTDTPAALKSYAEKVKAKPGWTFLTGSPQQVNAEMFVKAGAAEMTLDKDLTPDRLYAALFPLLGDPVRRDAMAEEPSPVR